MHLEQELSVALNIAEAAGNLQRSYEAALPEVEKKNDRSPVTEVDRACERLIHDRLMDRFPGDGFLGEESGSSAGTSGRQWIVDPLDGTRPYLRGIPTYSVLIALEDAGDPVLGVIHLPALGMTCHAAKGSGAFLNGKAIHVSAVSTLDSAMGTALGFREKAGQVEGARLLELMQAWDYAYGFMDAYSYVCVAAGRLDLAVNLLDKPWDCAAAACIVREAGGAFSDIEGGHSVHNGSIVLSNGVLHEAAIGFFRDGRTGCGHP